MCGNDDRDVGPARREQPLRRTSREPRSRRGQRRRGAGAARKQQRRGAPRGRRNRPRPTQPEPSRRDKEFRRPRAAPPVARTVVGNSAANPSHRHAWSGSFAACSKCASAPSSGAHAARGARDLRHASRRSGARIETARKTDVEPLCLFTETKLRLGQHGGLKTHKASSRASPRRSQSDPSVFQPLSV